MRNGLRAATALSRHMERGLLATPPVLLSPSGKTSCTTADPSGILATRPRRVSLAALRTRSWLQKCLEGRPPPSQVGQTGHY
eukprot:355607-Chlamydomonas_euryale.AAC.4